MIAAAAAAAEAAKLANPNGIIAPIVVRAKTPAAVRTEEVESASTEAPWKLLAVSSKVQFTCGLTDIGVTGRADFKAIKTVIRYALRNFRFRNKLLLFRNYLLLL